MSAVWPTQRQLAAIRRMRVDEAKGLREIADHVGMSYNWVRSVCIAHGFHAPADGAGWRGWTKGERQTAHALKAAGATHAEIGARLGRTTKAVGEELRRQRERAEMAAANRALVKAMEADGDEIRTSRRLRGRECGGGDPASATIADHDPPPPNSNAQRAAGVDGIILRRARFLFGKGWKLPDVARQVRVEPKALEAALRELAKKEAMA